jgi:predicted TIM-barrel fold metal-dependent hydrolase
MKPKKAHNLNYRIIDCDSHYYEPDDCFTRHIEEKFKERTVRMHRYRSDGLATPMIEDERLSFFSVGVSDYVGEPGSMEDFFQGKDDAQAQVNANPMRPEDHPEFTDRSLRLKKLDEQEVEACIMIPTLGVGVEYQMRKFPDLMYPSLRAFNRWLEEDWGYGEDKRIYSAPMMSLVDVGAAVSELDRLLKLGANMIYLTPGPINGRSPADKYYDPFWARINETGTRVVFHIGETGCNEMYAKPWGEPANPPSHRYSAFNTYVGIGERSIADTAVSMIFLNFFERFPDTIILAVEFGASWVPSLLNSMDKIYRMGDHKTRWHYGKPTDKPSDIFRRNFRVVPFYEDNIGGIADVLGTASLINGSDYPHPEGLAWPTDMIHYLEGVGSTKALKQIMRDNACEVLDLPV